MRIRTRFSLSFVLAGLIPLLAFAAVSYVLTTRIYENNFEEKQRVSRNHSKQVVDDMRALIDRQVQALADLKNPFLGQYEIDLEKFADEPGIADARLQLRAKAALGELDQIWVLGKDGRALAAPHSSAELHEKRAFLGELTLGGVVDGEGTTADKISFVKAVPVLLTGKELAVVGGVLLDQQWLERILMDGTRAARLVRGDKILLGKQGAWKRGKVFRINLGNEVHLEVFDSDEAFRKAMRRIQWIAGGIALASILLTWLFGGLVSRRITRGVDQLMEGVNVVGKGDWEHQVRVETGDELEELAESFNGMTTTLQRTQSQLMQTERIAAWQGIARQLAHEIKNPLTPIQMAMETLKRCKERQPEKFDQLFSESSDIVLSETMRLRKIVEEFAQFAKLPKAHFEEFHFGDFLEEAVAPYRETIAIEIRGTGVGVVVADRGLLQQLMLNLLENARHAMEDVSTSVIVIDVEEDGEFVTWSVRDHGEGLPHDTSQLFEPYFTTKGGKGGTGLGLSVVHRVATLHSGAVSVEHANPGARFRISILKKNSF